MLRPYLLWVRAGVVASCLIPLIVLAHNIYQTSVKVPESSTWDGIVWKLITITLVAALGCVLVLVILRRFAITIDVVSVSCLLLACCGRRRSSGSLLASPS
jgi:hypothetical protein